MGSSYVNLFNKFNQSFQVRVQADSDYRRQAKDIPELYIANHDGQMVPLGAIVTCPSRARIGISDALQPLPRRDDNRHRNAAL